MEAKLKHLEFLQAAISRMNQNSFVVKGWAVTLASALVALAVQQSNRDILRAAVAPIVVFWFLDAFYLSRERQFRLLYERVAAAAQDEVNMSMDVFALRKPWTDIPSAMFSRGVWPCHFLMALAVLIAAQAIEKPSDRICFAATRTFHRREAAL